MGAQQDIQAVWVAWKERKGFLGGEGRIWMEGEEGLVFRPE